MIVGGGVTHKNKTKSIALCTSQLQNRTPFLLLTSYMFIGPPELSPTYPEHTSTTPAHN